MNDKEYFQLTEEYKKAMNGYHSLLKEFFTERSTGIVQEATKFLHRKEDLSGLLEAKLKKDHLEELWLQSVKERYQN
ncbi:MAG: hypothetical protein NVS3B9_6180 [Candidatus Doudnabacteria bacterium]